MGNLAWEQILPLAEVSVPLSQQLVVSAALA